MDSGLARLGCQGKCPGGGVVWVWKGWWCCQKWVFYHLKTIRPTNAITLQKYLNKEVQDQTLYLIQYPRMQRADIGTIKVLLTPTFYNIYSLLREEENLP